MTSTTAMKIDAGHEILQRAIDVLDQIEENSVPFDVAVWLDEQADEALWGGAGPALRRWDDPGRPLGGRPGATAGRVRRGGPVVVPAAPEDLQGRLEQLRNRRLRQPWSLTAVICPASRSDDPWCKADPKRHSDHVLGRVSAAMRLRAARSTLPTVSSGISFRNTISPGAL
jgi:hypothetical protein